MAKRAFDAVVGGVLFILVLPLILLLAVAVALTFRTWPFFTQERVGHGGRRFTMVKLRTLPPTTPEDADKFQIKDLKVPRLAYFLRRTHLDELPQLALVPLGRMSLVGPRPEMVRLHDCGDRDFAALRTAVRPGCAGLWQISVHAGLLIWDAPEYDVFYINNASIRLDLWILARAALNLMGVGRAVTLADVPNWASAPSQRIILLPERPLRIGALGIPAGPEIDLLAAGEQIEMG